jgi:outer membrane protein OmpA-like peptidoglycan-associated protein
MRIRWVIIVAIASLSGCAWLTGSNEYRVYFQSNSTDTDTQAIRTIRAAADFAQAHPLQPVTVTGYSAPPDPNLNIDNLSGKRADKVTQMLVDEGVRPERITTGANGVTDPKTLPELAVRRVDVSIGK